MDFSRFRFHIPGFSMGKATLLRKVAEERLAAATRKKNDSSGHEAQGSSDKWSLGSATQSLWLKDGKVESQAVDINRFHLFKRRSREKRGVSNTAKNKLI